ncbi:hypothetical protein OsJ_30234 [Oryza sativa Japonica Group]|uniref:Uncharacterized protein n=1 Tax=Oryza sativa subsp. japonica TaxID=39947 RepID=A3C184_ORYSJ|nr:hypothetical protein OsJ_30234 [Oryza sativa Japonica Group]
MADQQNLMSSPKRLKTKEEKVQEQMMTVRKGLVIGTVAMLCVGVVSVLLIEVLKVRNKLTKFGANPGTTGHAAWPSPLSQWANEWMDTPTTAPAAMSKRKARRQPGIPKNEVGAMRRPREVRPTAPNLPAPMSHPNTTPLLVPSTELATKWRKLCRAEEEGKLEQFAEKMKELTSNMKPRRTGVG